MEQNLRTWKMLALVIADEHMNHKRRGAAVEALRTMVEAAQRDSWNAVEKMVCGLLMDLLLPIINHHAHGLTHTNSRAFLRLFISTCDYYLRKLYGGDEKPVTQRDSFSSDQFHQPTDVNDIPF